MAGLTLEERSRRPEYWLEIIEQARKHAGGVKGFCKENGIASKVYYRWFGKLRKDHPEWEPLTKAGKAFGRRPRAGVREFWIKKVATWRKSGLSVVDYCRREKLLPASLHSWKRKLELENRQLEAIKQCNGTENHDGQKGPSFVPLTVEPNASEKPIKSPSVKQSSEQKAVAEIIGRGSSRLMIFEGASEGTIKAIIGACFSQ